MGRIYAGWVLAALWGAGCGDTKEPLATEAIERHVDGSRLKAQVISTSQGLRWFQQIYDSQRQEPCFWRKAAPDGAYYCLGYAMGLLTSGPADEDDNYTDAHCTDPLRYFSQPPGPDTLIRMESGTCEGLPRFHAVGQVWGERYYHRKQNGDCVQEVRYAGSLYRLGPVVATGDYFVRGALQEKQSGGGIKAYVIEGEDGSETFQSLQDTTHDMECVVHRARDGSFRCMPTGPLMGANTSVSVDSTCTERALTTLFGQSCARPRFTLKSDATEICHAETSVIDVGEEVTQVYGPASDTDPTCRPRPPTPQGPRYYRAGAELPASRWPEAKEVDLKAHGRLTVRGMEVAGAVKLSWELFDTELGEPCNFERVPSGTLRCIPHTGNLSDWTRYFADAACTTPIIPEAARSCTARRYATFYDSSGISPGVRVYNVGSRHAGAVYFRDGFGLPSAPCMEWRGEPSVSFYVLGSELDSASLVQGMETRN